MRSFTQNCESLHIYQGGPHNPNMYNSYSPKDSRSIIVSNFPHRASEFQLGNFFNSYGRVLNVSLDRKRGEAYIEFADRKDVNSVTSSRNLFLNNRKLNVQTFSNDSYGHQSQHRKPGPSMRSYGGGGGGGGGGNRNYGPPPMDPYYNRPPGNYGGGSSNRGSRNAPYNNPNNRGNAPQSNREAEYSMKRRTGDIYHEKLCVELLKIDSVIDQIKKVRNSLLLKEEDHNSRLIVKKAIDSVLKETFPNSYTCVYGAALYDLAVSRSDLNLYLNLQGTKFNSENPENFDTEYNLNEVPSTHLLRAGEIAAEDIFELPMIAQLHFICDLFNGSGFKKASVLPRAYSPMISLTHSATGIECTLKIKCGLELRQSELINFYVKYEPRLRSLVPSLYMWARHHGLISPNNLNYHHFIWLVIFFLQTKGILPSVQKLQSLADEKIIVDGIDCSFCSIDKLPANEGQEPIEDLLVEFFKFFGDFDFSLMVVSTYYGEPILKTTLSIRDDASKDLKINCLTIQDCFNVAKNITDRCRIGFFYNLLEKFKVTKERVLSADFATKPQNERLYWGIPLIILKSIAQANFSSNMPQSGKRYGNNTEIVLPIRTSLLECVEDKETLAKKNSDELKELFYEKVCHCIFSYLNRGYLFECTTIIDRLETKLVPEKFLVEEHKAAAAKEIENGQGQGVKREREDDSEDTKEVKKPCPDEEAKKAAEEAKKAAADEEAKKVAADEEAKKAAADEEAKKAAEEAAAKAAATEEPAKPTEEENGQKSDTASKEEEKVDPEKKPEVKTEKEEKPAPVDPDLENLNVLYKGNFKSFYRTLMGRKQALSKISPEEKVIQYLEQEHLISLHIAKEAGRKPLLSAFEFDAVMKKATRGSLANLVLTLTPRYRTKEFVFLADMLQVRMNKIVEKILSKATVTLESPQKSQEPQSTGEGSEATKEKELDFTEDHYDDIEHEAAEEHKEEEQDEQELLKDDGEDDKMEDEPLDDSLLNEDN